MTYIPTYVEFSTYGTTGGETILEADENALGFPESFDNFLFSMWNCLAEGTSNAYNLNTIGTLQIVNGESYVEVQILLFSGFPAYIFLGNFTLSPPISSQFNILVSLNSVTQTIQVYANDVPMTLSSGGWRGSGPLNAESGIYGLWIVGGTYSIDRLPPGGADVFMAAPSDFFDLSVVENRRKFINVDYTPVYLGANGSGPLGVQPPIYLTVPSGGVADDFKNNYGFGGPLEVYDLPLVEQPAGSCSLPAPPALLTLTDLSVTTTVSPSSTPGSILLRWSDTAGASWSFPIQKSTGSIGQYLTAPTFYRLGLARNRVFEISWSDNVAEALQGVFLRFDVCNT